MSEVRMKASEELVQVVKETKDLVNDRFTKISDKQQALENMQGDLLAKLAATEKRSIYAGTDLDRFKFDPDNPRNFHDVVLKANPRQSDFVADVQKKANEVFMFEVIRKACVKNGVPNTPQSIQETRLWKEYGDTLAAIGVSKASGDQWGTAEATNWIPIDTSQDLHEFIEMQLRVAGLFPQFTLPTATFYWPHVTASPAAEVAAELSDPAAFPSYTAANQAYGVAPPDDRATFVAKKVRAFQFYTREFSEDTIRATIPWLMRMIPRAIARAWDSAIINGDVGGSTIGDNASTATSGWFDGLRAYVIGQGGGHTGDGTDLHEWQFRQKMSTPGTWAIGEFADGLRKQRKRMDKYGVMLNDLVYIVGLDAYFQMMSISGMQTLDDFGPQATLLTGQVGAFDSIPVVLSEFMNLSVESQDGTTPADNGINQAAYTREGKGLLLVYTPEWMRARLPGMGIEVVRFAHQDLYEVLTFERADFNTIGPATALNVNYGYDIPAF